MERDPETGRILRIIEPDLGGENDNPLNDPLNDIMDHENGEPISQPENDVVAALEAQAVQEEALLAKKRPRQQSQREEEWITKLVEKHGDNIKAMVRDRKLNPMQQTEGDIGRRLKKWKDGNDDITT